MAWRKTFRRTVFIVLAAVAGLCAVAYLAIHTRPASRFILAKAVQVAKARTGAQIEIHRIAIHWTDLGADVYGITVYGNGGPSQPPLFQCPHLVVRLNFLSLLEGRVGISRLVLDRSSVHFDVNAAGRTNLPQSPAAAKSVNAGSPLFAMAVRRVAIRDSRIDYNDATIPLSAELANFQVRVDFDKRLKEYKGFLHYDHGRFVYRNFRPIEHNLQARFVITRSGLSVDPLQVSTPKSHFTLEARLTDFAAPRIRASYRLDLYTPEIAPISQNPSLPLGEIRTTGAIVYRSAAGPSLFDRVRVNGQLSSPQLSLNAARKRVVARSVRGEYTMQKGNLSLANLQATVLGGQLQVKSARLSLAGQSPSRVNVTWRHASLQDFSAMLLPSSARRFHVVGRANMDAKISWSKNIRHMTVQSRLNMKGQAEMGSAVRKLPLNGSADVRYDGTRDAISFRDSNLQVGHARLWLDGTLSRQSNLRVKLETGDLQTFTGLLIQAGEAAKSEKTSALASLNLRGSAAFAGRVLGSLQKPRVQGHIAAHDLQFEGTQWRAITADVNVSASQVALKNGVLLAEPRGRLRLAATAGLSDGSFTPASPVSIDATATNLSIASLQRLAKLNYPVGGMLSASISVQGTREHPSGHGTGRIVRATAWNQPIRRIAIDFHGNGESVQSTAEMQTLAGVLQSELSYIPRTGQYEFSAHSSGLQLDQVQALRVRRLGIRGRLEMSASGRGTLANPEASAKLTLRKLEIHGQSIPNAQAQIDIAQHRAEFTTEMTMGEGSVRAKGSVALGGEYETTATLNAHVPSLHVLLARFLKNSPTGLEGNADVQADLSGPLKYPARIESHVVVPALHLAYSGAEIGLVRPLRLDYQGGGAKLQSTELKGTKMDFTVQGTIPVEKPAPMNVAVDGTVDLALLQAFTSGMNSSGRLSIRLEAQGPFSQPTMQGNIRIEKASLSSASIPVSLNDVNGQIRLSGDRFQIASLTGHLGGGTMSAQGFLIYGKRPRFNLALQANSLGVRYPRGLLSVMNCDLRFAGTRSSSLLSGRVLIDQLLVTKQFDLTTLASQFSSGSAPAAPSSMERHIRLNVSVQSAGNLRLASSQLSVQGGADLTLTGTLANPVVLGRATIGQGEVFFLGRRYEIQSGTVEFSNPIRNNPTLNIYATTTAEQYTITMNFVGSLDRLRTNFTSDPPLPPSDIISLIAFGKTSGQAGASPVTPSILGAESVLAKAVAGQVTGKIEKLAGISQLTINPLIGGNQRNPGAQVAIQQRVTGRLLLTFVTDTTQTQNSTVQIQYQASRHISVSALRDQNGGYSADIHFHKSF